MQQFEISTLTSVMLDYAKARKENHGDVLVLALDLSVTWNTHNSILDTIMPGLRQMLFTSIPPAQRDKLEAAEQERLDLQASDLPFVRCADITYPIKIEREWTGHKLRLDYGRGGDADKVVSLCKMKGMEITPIDGGSVELHWKIASSADISGEMIGIFSELIKQKISIQLLAPTASEEQAVIDASKDGDAPGTEKAKAKSKGKTKDAAQADAATEGFLSAHGAGAGPEDVAAAAAPH